MGLSKEFCEEMQGLEKHLKERSDHFLGYPCNADIDCCESLPNFLKYTINNIGDPFADSNYQVNTRPVERKVIDFFAKLYGLKEDYWGYVTNGGTEGNMYGLFLARELHPDAKAYFSQDAHYSISKIARVLKIPTVMVKSQQNGEMDYKNLERVLANNKNCPAIIVANIGSTMKGAIDNVGKIKQTCENFCVSYHIHADAALGGMILPFLENSPAFDFKAGISSMAISGHKMIGSPMPCGLALTKKEFVKKISREIEYVGTLDTTLSGSRNGISPILFWEAINKHGLDGFKKSAKQCMETADYAMNKLKEIKWECWKNDFSNIVVLKKPSEAIIKKWQLAVQGDIAHIVAMRHVSKQMIDMFISDLKQEHA